MVRFFKVHSFVVALVAASAACSYSPHPEDGKQECYSGRCPDGYVCASNNRCYLAANVPPGTGGAGTGGVIVGSGGVVGTGGKVGSGGIIGTGGVSSLGGVTGKGGTVGLGGIPGTGGVGAGGVPSQGGATSMGGVGAGGVPSQGGTTGMGGTTVTPPPTGTVMTVANGQAQGAMTGFGWIAFGSKDIVTDPTCSSPLGPLTSSTPCGYTVWSTPIAYCLSGTVPALPAVPVQSDYDANWGIQIGVNSTDPSGGGLGQSFSSVAITVTGSPSTGLRAILHRRGDAASATYCANLTSGLAIAFTSFNTACWSPTTGMNLALADVPNIDQIGVQVSSTTSAIPITNLCLSGITFTK